MEVYNNLVLQTNERYEKAKQLLIIELKKNTDADDLQNLANLNEAVLLENEEYKRQFNSNINDLVNKEKQCKPNTIMNTEISNNYQLHK